MAGDGDDDLFSEVGLECQAGFGWIQSADRFAHLELLDAIGHRLGLGTENLEILEDSELQTLGWCLLKSFKVAYTVAEFCIHFFVPIFMCKTCAKRSGKLNRPTSFHQTWSYFWYLLVGMQQAIWGYTISRTTRLGTAQKSDTKRWNMEALQNIHPQKITQTNKQTNK